LASLRLDENNPIILKLGPRLLRHPSIDTTRLLVRKQRT
jgi:hypothetical protein